MSSDSEDSSSELSAENMEATSADTPTGVGVEPASLGKCISSHTSGHTGSDVPTTDERDPYFMAWVRRDLGNGLVYGQIENIQFDKLTREALYHVHYVNDRDEYLSRDDVERYYCTHRYASAATWDLVDSGIDLP